MRRSGGDDVGAGWAAGLLRVAAAVQDACDTVVRIRLRPPQQAAAQPSAQPASAAAPGSGRGEL